MLFSCIALHCIVVQLIKRTHSRSARLECILLLLRRAWIWCTRCPGAKNVKPSSSKCQFAEIKLTRFWKAQIKLHPSHLSMSWRCSAPSFLFGREFMIILSKHASKSKFLGQMRIKNNWFGKVSESYTVIHCSAWTWRSIGVTRITWVEGPGHRVWGRLEVIRYDTIWSWFNWSRKISGKSPPTAWFEHCYGSHGHSTALTWHKVYNGHDTMNNPYYSNDYYTSLLHLANLLAFLLHLSRLSQDTLPLLSCQRWEDLLLKQIVWKGSECPHSMPKIVSTCFK